MNYVGNFNSDKVVIKIVYGEGPEALLAGIQNAIHRWREINLNDKDIIIYIPLIAQRYLMEYTAQYLTSPFKKNIVDLNISELWGITVLPGYEWGKVVVAWKEGELYGQKPIVITWDTPGSVEKVEIDD